MKELEPVLKYAKDGMYSVMNENYETDWNIPWKSEQSEYYDRYDDMMRNFAEIVRGKENPFPYDYELNLYKLVLRACGKGE